MRTKRWLVVGALVAVVAAAIAYGFRPRPIRVEGKRVERGHLEVVVVEEGKTRLKDRFVVSSPVGGYARRPRFKVGDPVARGQVLFELEALRAELLDPRSRAQAEARVEAAKATLEAAEYQAREVAAADEYAALNVERVRKLWGEGLATQEALDQASAEASGARSARRSAEEEAETRRFALVEARAALTPSAAERTRGPGKKVLVRAPAAGRILAVRQESEGVVAPGQPLAEIGDPRAMEVVAELLSSDAVRVRAGTRVRFERWGGEGPLEGRVRMIEPAGFTKVSALGVEEQRVVVVSDLRATPDAAERLGDGYRLEASFVVWEGDGILRVPGSALFRHGEGWAAFVVRDGRARLWRVGVGHRSSLEAEVLSGLSEGELVIDHPGDTVDEGVRVEVR